MLSLCIWLAEVGLSRSGRKNEAADPINLNNPARVYSPPKIWNCLLSVSFRIMHFTGLSVWHLRLSLSTPRKRKGEGKKHHTVIFRKMRTATNWRGKWIIQFSQMRASRRCRSPSSNKSKKLRSNKLLLKQSPGIRIRRKEGVCLVIATIPACLISMLLYSCIELPTRLAGEEDAERRGEEGRGEEKEGEKSERDSREREREEGRGLVYQTENFRPWLEWF